jgi:hypothetical protein
VYSLNRHHNHKSKRSHKKRRSSNSRTRLPQTIEPIKEETVESIAALGKDSLQRSAEKENQRRDGNSGANAQNEQLAALLNDYI